MTNNPNTVTVLPAACVSGTAISSMGMAAPPLVESTAVPAPRSSPPVYPARVPGGGGNGNTFPEFNSVSVTPKQSKGGVWRLPWFCICSGLSWSVHRSGSDTEGFTALEVSDEGSIGQTLPNPEYLMTNMDGSCEKEVHSSGIFEEVQQLLTAESEEQLANKLPHTTMLTEWLSYLKNLLRGK